ncbi:MAG: dihydroneopterin aldolase [Magnetococcales bacterium]|nr:dihydroneopterin aldolase [Magnetococcales bacterium]MBF0155672.1 dihydroneopterin aldolase [Magnetococcales bacterium]
MGSDRIVISDLSLRCVIGVQEWERRTRQEVLINIVLFADLAGAGASDRIEDTVNYRTLGKRLVAMVEASTFQLVEALAQAVMELCLDDPRVQGARVRVEKPGALRFARSVGVEIERFREAPSRIGP